jgi:hypothetical protein
MFITKQISRNVHTVKCTYKAGWEQWFLLMSDQHHDHPYCDEKLLTKHLDQALEKKAGILSFGDWVCGMQTKFDKRGSRSKVKTEHIVDNYIDAIVESEAEYLSKYAENFIVFGRGNHEEGLSKRFETDIIQRIVDKTNEKAKPKQPLYAGGYGGWVKFQFERESKSGSKGARISFNLKYRHSGGSLGTVTRGTLGVNRMALDAPDADIIVSGDNHEEWQMTVVQERLSEQGVISHREQLHIKLPTYKNEYNDGHSGWHVETNKSPRPLGGMWLRFYYEDDTIKCETIRAK